MSNPDVLNQCKVAFGLESSILHAIDHKDTIIAEVYRVTHPSRPPLILKLCAREADYHRELHALRLLAGSLPVPAVIDTVAPSSASPGALLLEHLEGHLLQSNDWTPLLAYEVGALLARLHLHRTDGYADLTSPRTLVPSAIPYFEEKFLEELDECRDHLPESLLAQSEHYLSSHQYLLEAVDGPCMIHRDFRPGNLMVHNGKNKRDH